ncbi:cob(I)yrinic acid a,c-diamide adenosyltransferase [Candidatus Falkowbacteria bacterium]|nr:cob(I)yrinic acid a,c-diamide adenosyltransferase [Candidatus Falkowbacteria bacterium]
MALYTGKGDDGTTKLFDCPSGSRLSKSAKAVEALGNVDELNTIVGLARALNRDEPAHLTLDGAEVRYTDILMKVQQQLFIVQADLAGADKKITPEHLDYLERVIAAVTAQLPPPTSFVLSGGSPMSAILDLARTVTRRAERSIVAVNEEGIRPVSATTLAFMNRLSSLCYALARYANYQTGLTEIAPTYQ